MKVLKNVKSTASSIPSLEVNLDKNGAIDTVYVRQDITIPDEKSPNEKNIGTEIHYTAKEFLSNLPMAEDTGMLALMVSMLMSEVDMLSAKLRNLEEGK